MANRKRIKLLFDEKWNADKADWADFRGWFGTDCKSAPAKAIIVALRTRHLCHLSLRALLAVTELS